MPSTDVLALNIHAGFECRRSGACCSAGWPIPVEADVAAAILRDEALAAIRLRTARPGQTSAAAVIEPAQSGACPFLERAGGHLCAIQRRLGHGALPSSCRHFPRVALLEADAVRVTLSHFCPTAAWMLFKPSAGRLAIVPDAVGIADRPEHDGFDARHTIPPLLRPGVAMDAATCRAWERYTLDALDSDDLAPEDALADLLFAAEAIRNWSANVEPLETRAAKVLTPAASRRRLQRRWTMSFPEAMRLHQLAADAVPRGLMRPATPEDAESADRAWVAPQWAACARPLGRYLAARAFGAWSAYLGQGLRTQVAMLAVALAAVRTESARETARASRSLDERLLHAAVRSADLLLHHLSDAATLVRRMTVIEHGSPAEALAIMGLGARP